MTGDDPTKLVRIRDVLPGETLVQDEPLSVLRPPLVTLGEVPSTQDEGTRMVLRTPVPLMQGGDVVGDENETLRVIAPRSSLPGSPLVEDENVTTRRIVPDLPKMGSPIVEDENSLLRMRTVTPLLPTVDREGEDENEVKRQRALLPVLPGTGAGIDDEPPRPFIVPLTGRYRNDVDPATIGETNFQTMVNLRPTPTTPVGVSGMAAVNTNLLKGARIV